MAAPVGDSRHCGLSFHMTGGTMSASTRSCCSSQCCHELPAGSRSGLNDWKRIGYGGPCPPTGRHRYFHKLYALDTLLPDLGKPTKAVIEAQMKGHIVAQAELMGTYQKHK